MPGVTPSAKRSGSGRRRSRRVKVLQLLLPGLGDELEDVTCGMTPDAHDDVAEVLEGVDPIQLASGEQRVQDAGRLGSVLATGEEPIPTHRDAPELPLGSVIVELEAGRRRGSA
jgi:hypothetical protein